MSRQPTIDQTPNETVETVDGAFELLKNQIAWLEYVPENEMTETERSRIIKACERLTSILTKLNHKYND